MQTPFIISGAIEYGSVPAVMEMLSYVIVSLSWLLVQVTYFLLPACLVELLGCALELRGCQVGCLFKSPTCCQRLLPIKKLLDDESVKKVAAKGLENELKNRHEIAQKRIEELMMVNNKLEKELLMAAGQVSDAFARISSTHDDMERISKEFHESKHAHAKLTKEHDRILTELEMTRTALLQAEKDVEGNKKDIEEITAARKAAQEGQNAAIDQLMKQLNELGAVAVVENNEVESGKLQVTILENKALHEQLLQSNTAVRELQERCSDLQKHLLDVEQGDKRLQEKKIVKIEALDGSNVSDAYERDSLIKDIYELKFQNEYLKLHLEHFCADIIQSGSTEDAIVQFKESSQGNHSYTVSQLHREITDLSKQLEESRASLAVAEDNIKQFHLAISQSDERVQELSTQLVEDHKNMENQIKERDEKFAELDLKFGRLQKRAKQRIQELQKEKDDIEAQLSIARDKASQAMIQQSEIKQELERVRHETGEALRSIDGEKQRLHIANNAQSGLEEYGKSLYVIEVISEILNVGQVTFQLQPMLKHYITNFDKNDLNIQDIIVKFRLEYEFANLAWYPSHHKVVYKVDDKAYGVLLQRYFSDLDWKLFACGPVVSFSYGLVGVLVEVVSCLRGCKGDLRLMVGPLLVSTVCFPM
ncbi:hypothetical protein SUGI_0980410 [Cryptomeria japonica]|nr:hypothetical protein SUGI_0980410 [Cryptomeria japonica]